MAEQFDLSSPAGNPLDIVEDILAHQDWTFDRPSPGQLSVTISGRLSAYALNFFWQEDFSAMQVVCAIDLDITEARRDVAARVLMTLNAVMPIGHFILQDGVPCFRYTSLLRDPARTADEDDVEDIIEIAIGECDRAYPAFHLAAAAETWTPALDLALADSAGEA